MRPEFSKVFAVFCYFFKFFFQFFNKNYDSTLTDVISWCHPVLYFLIGFVETI